MKTYNKVNIPLAKSLRKSMTPWERKLWYLFLRRSPPLRFQRQKAIGNYIVDFYCAKIKLIIELDGGGHFTQEKQTKDHSRTRDLNALGFFVLRFTNTDIDCNFSGVFEHINRIAEKLSLPQSKPTVLTAPSSEGAE